MFVCYSFEISVDMLDYMDEVLILQEQGKFSLTPKECNNFGLVKYRLIRL